MRGWVLLIAAAVLGAAQDLPLGRVIDKIACIADPQQTYALYVPSNYSATKKWKVIFAFDPLARGRVPVERFQDAAEKYGYIVAGSNNSRNGSWEVSLAAIRAMPTDVSARFSIDHKFTYLAGFSGGARVAMQVALNTHQIAGVIASSAGFPDGEAHKTAPFPVFATAGIEDFNLWEIRALDRTMTSPHRVVIFAGSHTWLSKQVAVEGVEWMELQAMKSGLEPRDPGFLDRTYDSRLARATSQSSDESTYLELKSLAADFDGLRDVGTLSARALQLEHQKSVKDASKKERAAEAEEQRINVELVQLEQLLQSPDKRTGALEDLRQRLAELTHDANAKDDSEKRRMARRILRGTFVRSFEAAEDTEYHQMVQKIEVARP